MATLDSFGVITPDNEMKVPLILSDAHAHYLYETSCERMMEKQYERQIDEKLAEERAEKEELELKHKKYASNNYVRVGGN